MNKAFWINEGVKNMQRRGQKEHLKQGDEQKQIYILSYLPNPSTRAGYDTRSIF